MKLLQLQEFTGQQRFSSRINGSEKDSWYFLHELALMKWTNRTEMQAQVIQWNYFFNPENGHYTLLDNNTLLLGNIGGGQPLTFIEYDLPNNLIKDTKSFGDNKTRWGDSIHLKDGSFFCIVSVDTRPQNLCIFDVCYRKTTKFPFEMNVTKKNEPWVYRRLTFPSNTGDVHPYFIKVIQGPDGKIYAFFTRDSAKTVGVLIFSLTPDDFILETFDGAFIPHNEINPCSIQGEFPNLEVIVVDNKFIFCYQLFESTSFFLQGNPQPQLTSPWGVVEVDLAGNTRLLARSTKQGMHNEYPKPVLWNRPNGLYTITQVGFPNEDNTRAITEHETFHCNSGTKINTLPNGKLLSSSCDGIFGYYLRDEQKTLLLRLKMPSRIKIVKCPFENINIDWDMNDIDSPDTIEKSEDGGKTWITYVENVLPILNINQYVSKSNTLFRVKDGV